MSDYRLIQNGLVVAQISGPEKQAMVEMYRYARTYAQDGPLKTERRFGQKWVPIEMFSEDQPNE